MAKNRSPSISGRNRPEVTRSNGDPGSAALPRLKRSDGKRVRPNLRRNVSNLSAPSIQRSLLSSYSIQPRPSQPHGGSLFINQISQPISGLLLAVEAPVNSTRVTCSGGLPPQPQDGEQQM